MVLWTGDLIALLVHPKLVCCSLKTSILGCANPAAMVRGNYQSDVSESIVQCRPTHPGQGSCNQEILKVRVSRLPLLRGSDLFL